MINSIYVDEAVKLDCSKSCPSEGWSKSCLQQMLMIWLKLDLFPHAVPELNLIYISNML